MYSPLRQVEAQREVVRKIWESKTSKITKLMAFNKFNYYRRVLVVVANPETILNTTKAPKDMKHKILRADALVRQIEYDLKHRDSDDCLETRKSMEKIAKTYMNLLVSDHTNYYDYYKNKYCKSIRVSEKEDLRNRLIQLRKDRSEKMHLPAYYIFTNEELDKLLDKVPKTIEELKKFNILMPVKIHTHGTSIIEEINKKS